MTANTASRKTPTATKTPDTNTITATSCSGTREHECRLAFLPTLEPEAAGFAIIGTEGYKIECLGSWDEFRLTKPDGTAYNVSHWSDTAGNFSCTCRDWMYRSRRGERFCKHISLIRFVKAKQAAKDKELSMADLGQLVWEE